MRRDAPRRALMAAVTALLLGVLAPAASAAPTNDDFPVPAIAPPGGTFIPVNSTWNQSTVDATVQPGETGQCSTNLLTKTVWYRFSGTGGPVIVSTDVGQTNYDTIVEVYAANADGSPGALVDCNDDTATTQQSRLVMQSQVGVDYLVQIGGCFQCDNGAGGFTADSGDLSLTLLGNDARANAEPIGAGQTVTRTSFASSVDAGEAQSCGGVSYGSTVWFRFTATQPGTATFITSAGDSTVAVFAGADAAAAACSTSNAGTLGARTSLVVAPGEYFVQVGGVGAVQNSVINYSVEFTPGIDGDRDGFNGTPGPDCNDADAAIHPGAADVPDNGVDEDCSGADAVNQDRDRDGYNRTPGPDCNDADATIHPGAADTPGNGVDENCNGSDAAFPRLAARIKAAYRLYASYTRFSAIVVTKIPAGGRVTIRCRGRGCPIRDRTTVYARGRLRVDVWRPWHGSRLRPGAVIEVRVSHRDAIGVFQRITVRNRRNVLSSDRCIAANAARTFRC